MNDLISTHALDDHLNDNGLVVLDASWHMLASGRNARHEFEKAHIEGARFFDLDGVSDQHSSLPHMLPSAEDFSKAMAALGINSSSISFVMIRLACFPPRVAGGCSKPLAMTMWPCLMGA